MGLRTTCLLIVLTQLCAAELIDRVALNVGDTAITEREIVQEIRLTAFLNAEQPEVNSIAKRAAAERLLNQSLILEEMRLIRYAMPSAPEVDKKLKEVTETLFGGSAEKYQAALGKYHISERELRAQLRRQMAVMGFIDVRFAPGVQVMETDIRQYYETQLVPQLQKSGAKIPSLPEVRGRIREILGQEQVNKALDAWLEDVRKRSRIEFHEEAF